MIQASFIDLNVYVQGSDCDEISSRTPERVSTDGTLNQAAKTCADCGTTKTPLWRGGPAGPKVYKYVSIMSMY